MAIFTPNNNYMKLLKTTINTNRYFEENKKVNIESGIMVDNDYNALSTMHNKFDDIDDDVKLLKTFNEQQIKINKQTKNNFDKLNRKVIKVSDDIITITNNSKQEIIDKMDSNTKYINELYNDMKVLENGNSNLIMNYMCNQLREPIDKTNYNIDQIYNYLKKTTAVIGWGLIISILANISLFAYLIGILSKITN